VVEGGKAVAQMFVHSATSRAWTREEVAFVRDFAERTRAAIARRAAEQDLRASEGELRFTLKAGRLGAWTLDIATGELTTSELCRINFGRDPGYPFTYAELLNAVHPDDKERMAREVERSVTTGGDYDIEYRLVTPAGETRWIAIRARPSYSNDGSPLRMTGVSLDVTERKRTEEALLRSEARYRTLFESIESGFCVVEVDLEAASARSDYRVVEANPAFYRQTGLPDAIRGSWLREAAPDLEEHWYESYGRVARTGEPERFEQFSKFLQRWFDVFAFRVGEPGERRVAILFNDISERRNAEARLRELNDTLEAQVAIRSAERDRLWNLSEDMLARADYSGMMLAVSPAWTRVLGWSEAELLTRDYSTFMHPEDMPPTLEAIRRMAESGEPARFENRIATVSGEFKPIEWVVAPEPDGVNFIAVGRDLSLAKARQAELEVAREALRQSQKLESMGQLTGGVAHDLNNLLTPIMGSLDLLRRHGVGGEREQRMIDGALQSAERARVLVQRLLAFARKQPLQPVAVDIGRLVRGITDLVASTSGPRVQVELDVAPGLPAAKADANQLEMALLNLAVNSRDAMPNGGRLTISARHEAVGAQHRVELAPGDYVRLSVADTGAGMDKATLTRAIEPFYSTKGVGKGTGLGLSMAHGLAGQLGGALSLSSKPGVGTNVELWLPVSLEAVQSSEPTLVNYVQVLGTALIVDDEELVRLSTADMLADLGYGVVEAGSAEEALQLIEGGLSFDLLVTDHLMAGMTGTEFALKVRARQPDVPVLVVSGYAEVEGIAPELPRLTKPYKRDDLAASIAELTTGR
jgi:PAS domain S-box-containing protein